MMKRKTIKVALLVGLVALVVLAANVVMGASKVKSLPEYIGSQACLGCHTDKWANWAETGHANMLNPVKTAADLPADPKTAPADLQKELAKAQFIVAGQRFVAQDPATGHYLFLNVQWDGKQYSAMKGGSDWTSGCGGCHTTNFDNSKPMGAANTWSEDGIGCEACHGPGRDHVLAKGDPTKIVSNMSVDTCGWCHSGMDRATTGGVYMADGTKWPVGYRPGMKISDVLGLNLSKWDASKLPPTEANHERIYSSWAVTGHAKSIESLANDAYASDDCYTCHTAEGIMAKAEGKKFDATNKAQLNPVTCVACHDPHGNGNEFQLRNTAETACTVCHINEALAPGKPAKAGSTAYETNDAALKGYGAVGIKETPSFHSDLTCQDCHMTEGNHMFKVIRPDAADLAADRADSCTACHAHEDSSKDSRAAYLEQWQNTFTTKTAALDADKKVVAAALKANPNALTPELKAKYDTVVTNLSIIENDGSKGAHNFEYAMKIITQATKDLAAVKAGLK